MNMFLKHAQQIHQNTMFTKQNQHFWPISWGNKGTFVENESTAQALRPYLDKIAALEDGCHGFGRKKTENGALFEEAMFFLMVICCGDKNTSLLTGCEY